MNSFFKNYNKESSLLPVPISGLPTLVEWQIKTNALYPNRCQNLLITYLNPYLWKLGNPYFYIIPFRQAIIGQCPIGVITFSMVLVNLLVCQAECASCLPPNVCNVYANPLGAIPGLYLSTKCVPPLPTQVNNRLLLEHIQVI